MFSPSPGREARDPEHNTPRKIRANPGDCELIGTIAGCCLRISEACNFNKGQTSGWALSPRNFEASYLLGSSKWKTKFGHMAMAKINRRGLDLDKSTQERNTRISPQIFSFSMFWADSPVEIAGAEYWLVRLVLTH